jgi:hypothetical protein
MKKYISSLSSLVIFIVICFGIFSCNTDDDSLSKEDQNRFVYKKIGLNGIKVIKLVLEDNLLYAATEDGIFKKNINQEGSFEAIGLQGKNVEAILVLNQDEIIASVADFQEDIVIHIASTTNGGGSWQVMETNFGGGSLDPHIVWEFLKTSGTSDVIYATSNYVVAKSLDKGINWTPIWGDWEQFARATSSIAINPLIPGEMWLGGQGGMEDGYLVRLENSIEKNRWLDLVANPTTVKKIVFDMQDPQSIYFGFEGALLKTSTNGQSWETLIDEHESAMFFNGITISELDNNKIFASGWLKGGESQPLVLYYSEDKGLTWIKDVFTEEPFGGVEDMLLKKEGNIERLFLALDKGGIYEIKIKD